MNRRTENPSVSSVRHRRRAARIRDGGDRRVGCPVTLLLRVRRRRPVLASRRRNRRRVLLLTTTTTTTTVPAHLGSGVRAAGCGVIGRGAREKFDAPDFLYRARARTTFLLLLLLLLLYVTGPTTGLRARLLRFRRRRRRRHTRLGPDRRSPPRRAAATAVTCLSNYRTLARPDDGVIKM